MAKHRATSDTPPAVRSMVRLLVTIRVNRDQVTAHPDGTVTPVRRHRRPWFTRRVVSDVAETLAYGAALCAGLGGVLFYAITI